MVREGWLRAGAVIGVLAVFAGCSGSSGRETPQDTATTRKPSAKSFSPPYTPPPSPSPSASSAAEACGGRRLDPDRVLPWDSLGPAYTGKGTHAVRMFKGGPEFEGTESGPPLPEEDSEPRLPEEWLSEDSPQLVVCELMEQGSKGGKLLTCEYEELGGDGSVSTRVPVYAARYDYRVFETRTGRLVDTFELSGSASPWDSCPVEQSDIAYREAVFQHVSSRDLTNRLRALVKGPARH